jgi:hypothetical protein
VWCLSSCFPATVAILLIGLRDLYHVYGCALNVCVSSCIRYFEMWGLPISLWCSGRGVGSECLVCFTLRASNADRYPYASDRSECFHPLKHWDREFESNSTY